MGLGFQKECCWEGGIWTFLMDSYAETAQGGECKCVLELTLLDEEAMLEHIG